jgi:adenosine kinase
MSEARQIELAPLAAQEPIDLVLIGPNDPEAMLRHTEESRARGMPFAADPSQQLAWSEGPQIKALVEDAAYLFSNDYEAALISSKTGWTDADVLARVGVRITTHGKDGTVVEQEGAPSIRVSVVPAHAVVDPTGVGDAFRAGFLTGLAWGLSYERCAQVGSLLATNVLETVGPQEYRLEPRAALARFADAYGDEAASEVARHLRGAAPA